MNLISENEFAELFESAGLKITDGQYKKFSLYADLLAEGNAVMNLTAISDPFEVAEKHFLDSCLPLKFVALPDGSSLCDVGAGAGFPCLPMAVYRPDIRPTAIDSLNKRVVFLQNTAAALEVGMNCLHMRAEDAGRGALRESFDVVTARAVSRLQVLCEYCLPLTKVGGVFLAMKGGDSSAEVDAASHAIKTLGGRLEKLQSYSLPSGDRRTLAVIRKISPTPAAYPRQQGKISAKPL